MPIKFFNSDLLLNWCTMSYSNADISFSVIWVFFSSFFDMFVSIFLFAASLLLITLNPDSFPCVISDDLFMNTVWQTLLPRLSSYLALYRMIFFILVVLFIRFSLSWLWVCCLERRLDGTLSLKLTCSSWGTTKFIEVGKFRKACSRLFGLNWGYFSYALRYPNLPCFSTIDFSLLRWFNWERILTSS